MNLMWKLSAWVPIAMSITAATIFGIYILFGGPIVHEVEEGIGARLFQLLLVGQLPIIIFFAATWLKKSTLEALQILSLQLFAAIIALAPVFILEV